MQQALDAAIVRRWFSAAEHALGEAREEIDALNVFPVPDGDTGTNLFLTMEAAVAAADAVQSDDVGEVVHAAARGALLGARGNSGVILSQFLLGAAQALAAAGAGPHTGVDFAAALSRAADLGYQAVARPVEGTMLTVQRAAARAAQAVAGPQTPLFRVARAGARGAREALARTPDQLEALRLAGVVDAGGRGLVVLLDAFDTALTGWRPVERAPVRVARPARPGSDLGGDGPAYEVMYLLEADAGAVEALRRRLDGMGDSLLVVGGAPLWNVHVHTDDVGAAIEAGIETGRPYRLRVTHFADQRARRPDGEAGRGRTVVAVAGGEGLSGLFVVAGAAVVAGGPGRRCSTAELFQAMLAGHTGEAVLLPNDRDTIAVAEAAAARARAEGLRVAVIPTTAQVQGIAALAVHDAGRSFDEDVVAMTAAAGHTRHGAVTIAARDAVTSAGRCRAGDVLGVVEGDVVLVGADLAQVACQVVDRMLSAGGELVTLVTGAGTGAAAGAAVVAHLHATRPDLDATVHEGGQEHYPLLVGVE